MSYIDFGWEIITANSKISHGKRAGCLSKYSFLNQYLFHLYNKKLFFYVVSFAIIFGKFPIAVYNSILKVFMSSFLSKIVDYIFEVLICV